MTLHNEDIGAAFDEMADLLAIQGENTFRIRAYRRAAQVVRTFPPQAAIGAAGIPWAISMFSYVRAKRRRP